MWFNKRANSMCRYVSLPPPYPPKPLSPPRRSLARYVARTVHCCTSLTVLSALGDLNTGLEMAARAFQSSLISATAVVVFSRFGARC